MAKRSRSHTYADVSHQDRLPTREEIMAYLQTAGDRTSKRDIVKAFKIKSSDRRAFKDLLMEMTDEGVLVGNRKEFRQPGSLPPVTVLDIVHLDDEGELIGEPVVWNTRDGPRPRVILPTTPTLQAGRIKRLERAPGVGDRVLARIHPQGDENGDAAGFAFAGEVIKRLPREKQSLLGIFRSHARGGGVITPVDRKQSKDWPVQSGNETEASDGDLVRFDVLRTARSALPGARVVEVLGNPTDQRQVSLIAVHAHGIADEFPQRVLEALDDLPDPAVCDPAGPGSITSGRADMRDLPFVTIDPTDARDHDDAVHAAPDLDPANPGGWIVTVAIADVAHYVRPGTVLDLEAQKRGNSVYFPDRVVPMLPEAISNDLCSLREGVERPCLAVRMIFDKSGEKRSHKFQRGLLRTAMKLSYEEAQQAFYGRAGPRASLIDTKVLQPLWQAYQVMAAARRRRAPLELELPERRIVLDEAGKVDRIVVPARLDAHKLIEEFMIQANVAAAETLEKHAMPLIYRAHDQPSKEKLNALREFLHSLDLKLPVQGTLRPEVFNRILSTAKALPVADLVSEVILRAQAQAEYTPENYGHFGLNLRRYAHFTSPIRRYADLIVHRALIRALRLGSDGLTDEESSGLNAIAQHISQTERRAMAAERETVDRLIAAYLSSHVGAEFAARISGVNKSGLFVRLRETGADGFIPAASLHDDFYLYMETQHAMVGERSGLSYRLGDDVDVRLKEAIPVAGALRFEMLSAGRKGHISLLKSGRAPKQLRGRRRQNRLS
ncbi:MAG: ribonuclease R [Pseudomonadota bacterium]